MPIDTSAEFATKFAQGEAIDPDSGASDLASRTEKIHLAPYESRVFFFSEKPVSYRDQQPAPMNIDLSKDWKVTFTSTKQTVTESPLTDWLASPDTKNYSGEAVYSRDFQLDSKLPFLMLAVDGGKPLPGAPNAPAERVDPTATTNGLPNPLITRPGPGMHAYYDAPIREAALVTINGQDAGALWHPPYRLDISKFLKPGLNHIEIRVYNTALNAWAALPPHDYKPLIAKYGDRFQMQDLDKVTPVSSGILGTIHLITQDRQ